MLKSLQKLYHLRTVSRYLKNKPIERLHFTKDAFRFSSSFINNNLRFMKNRCKYAGYGIIFASSTIVYCYAADTTGLIDEFFDSISSGDIDEVKRLIINRKVDVNTKHKLGWNAIHSAANLGDSKMVKCLLDAGADLNALDEFSTSYKVASRNQIRLFEVVRKRSENFQNLNDRQDFSGFTPLHYAVLSDDFETIKLLINAGADPTIRDNKGHYAYEYAGTECKATFIQSSMQTFTERKKLLEAEERKRYPLENRFKEVIIGQEGAINAVASAVRRRENGWYDEEHPLVFLFLGSSGIGKTELAKQLAKYLHKDIKKGFIRLDMSEYQGKHEVAKLIGAPPGYIGHDQGGQLTKKLKEFPKAVVLFDEVDKAHPDVLTCMLQLFDEGRLTDGNGKTIECKDAIFVMTSNLASEDIAQHALELRSIAIETTKQKQNVNNGNVDEEITISRRFKEDIVYPILKSHFRRDEFLGRITEFVYFLPFSRVELMHLVEKELQFWAERANKNHSIELSWDNDVLSILAEGYDIHYGARSIKHEVERRIVNQIATAHERDIIRKNSKIHLVASYSSSQGTLKQEQAIIKLQLINENKKKEDILLENVYDPDTAIYF